MDTVKIVLRLFSFVLYQQALLERALSCASTDKPIPKSVSGLLDDSGKFRPGKIHPTLTFPT